MKKLSGLLAVSLVAVMMAPAAFADIASTEYVDKNMEVKANKKTSDVKLDDKDDISYPSVAAAFSIAGIALGDNAVIKEQGTDSANKALVTNAKGTVETGQIKAGMIANGAVGTGNIVDKAVTTAKIADENVTTATIANLAVTTEKIADANVTEGKLATDSVTPLKVKDGLVKGSGSVSVERDPTTGVITVSGTDTQYDDAALARRVTTLENTGVTKEKIDAIAKKQDKLVASGENANIVGSDGVSVSIGTNGKITVAGNQTAINSALDGKQDKLTAGTGIKIDTNNTISTDGLATNSDLTALQKTVSGHTTSIDRLDGADTVDGSVKQQIKKAKSDLTTDIQANTTAAAEAKSAAEAAQATAKKAVVANNAITAGTGTKITYDAKGLVTGSTSLAASDIPALTTGKITGLDDALAAKFVAPGTSVTSKDGTYTLTMKVADGKPTYAWESIGR